MITFHDISPFFRSKTNWCLSSPVNVLRTWRLFALLEIRGERLSFTGTPPLLIGVDREASWRAFDIDEGFLLSFRWCSLEPPQVPAGMVVHSPSPGLVRPGSLRHGFHDGLEAASTKRVRTGSPSECAHLRSGARRSCRLPPRRHCWPGPSPT